MINIGHWQLASNHGENFVLRNYKEIKEFLEKSILNLLSKNENMADERF